MVCIAMRGQLNVDRCRISMCTHEPWLSRSMQEVRLVQHVSVSVAHLVA
jgi:hypothetical protein